MPRSRTIKIKRIYETPADDDGFRVLVDRLWPRGIKKENAQVDLWAKQIAPSTDLRKWFDHDPTKFDEFRKRYTRELFDRYVAPNEWDAKVEIVRQFIAECGVHLSTSIRADQPERYAQNFEELIRSYVEALQRTSSVFRRL